MLELILSNLAIISLCVALIACCGIFVAMHHIRKLTEKLALMASEFHSLEAANTLLENEVERLNKSAQPLHQQMGIALEHLADLDGQVQVLRAELRDIASQDPQIKLYKRAKELLDSGASVEDVVASCDLPRAEVELLVAIKS